MIQKVLFTLSKNIQPNLSSHKLMMLETIVTSSSRVYSSRSRIITAMVKLMIEYSNFVHKPTNHYRIHSHVNSEIQFHSIKLFQCPPRPVPLTFPLVTSSAISRKLPRKSRAFARNTPTLAVHFCVHMGGALRELVARTSSGVNFDRRR